MKEDSSLREKINAILAKDGLVYRGDTEVKHLLSVLYKDVGLTVLKEKVQVPFKKLKIATHYGCHALRPSEITEFDNPVAPVLFDQLVEVTGAKSLDWESKLECCGAPLMGVNDDLSMDLTGKKLASGKEAGADYLCVACPYCQMQFDAVQGMMLSQSGLDQHLASILYPQLLGLSMGINKGKLGIGMNQLDISGVTSFLTQE